jgi:nitrate reductase NapE component
VTLDVAAAKRRMMVMLAIDVVCLIIAVAAAVGAFAFGVAWLQLVFGAALLAGFGAQIWFIAGIRRTSGGS